LGVHLGEDNFPVGKVDFLELHPFSFEEFLRGIGDERSLPFLTDPARDAPLPTVVHDHLWNMLKVFLVVGGLPEVVATYASLKTDLPTALESVRKKQGDLLTAYLADVAKHSGKENSMHIERVWQNVPTQLARELDGSSSKFRFRGVVPGVSGYGRLAGAIDWLKTAGLVHKIPIVHSARLPLSAFGEESVFKLYPFDTGLLGALGRPFAEDHPGFQLWNLQRLSGGEFRPSRIDRRWTERCRVLAGKHRGGRIYSRTGRIPFPH
jgi:predicted AAA+ superfamily ATPase